MFWYVLCLVALLKGHYLTNYFTDLYLSYSFWSIKFLSASVCCVILFPFSTWLAATTNTTVVRSKHQHNSICKHRCDYCSYSWAAASTAGAVIAIAIAVVWEYFKNIYCCEYRICQQHCYCYYGHCLVGLPLLLLAAVTIVVKEKVSQQYYIFFFSFCFGGDDSEFDSKGDGNDNGNGYDDD
jgi:hypothetical protein